MSVSLGGATPTLDTELQQEALGVLLHSSNVQCNDRLSSVCCYTLQLNECSVYSPFEQADYR
jgi:hypothetical protein